MAVPAAPMPPPLHHFLYGEHWLELGSLLVLLLLNLQLGHMLGDRVH